MPKKRDVLDEISEEDAYIILKRLASEDNNIKKRIEKIALDYLSDVDIDEIAEDVFDELDRIEVEELWDQSGKTRYGYVDPNERAWEMFEEQLEPFIDQMEKYQNLSMHMEAKRYCLGILKGIHKFEKSATTEFADWVIDAPQDYFKVVHEKWKKRHKDQEDIREVEYIIKKELNFGDNYMADF